MTMAQLLSKQGILDSRSHRRTAIVDLPELGGSLIIIELTGKERDAFEASLIARSKDGKRQNIDLRNLRAKLVARTVVQSDDFTLEENNGVLISATLKPEHQPRRMFNDLEANDLGDISAAALQRLFEASQHLSGISTDDVQELVGELKNDQNGASGID